MSTYGLGQLVKPPETTVQSGLPLTSETYVPCRNILQQVLMQDLRVCDKITLGAVTHCGKPRSSDFQFTMSFDGNTTASMCIPAFENGCRFKYGGNNELIPWDREKIRRRFMEYNSAIRSELLTCSPLRERTRRTLEETGIPFRELPPHHNGEHWVLLFSVADYSHLRITVHREGFELPFYRNGMICGFGMLEYEVRSLLSAWIHEKNWSNRPRFERIEREELYERVVSGIHMLSEKYHVKCLSHNIWWAPPHLLVRVWVEITGRALDLTVKFLPDGNRMVTAYADGTEFWSGATKWEDRLLEYAVCNELESRFNKQENS